VLQRWLGAKRLSGVRVLNLSSYHAIIACVAAGTGIALIPESVLATLQDAHVATHALSKVYSDVTTPLVWRKGEHSPALAALQEIVAPPWAPTSRVIA
jgi:DNA-binding transcriptional LysR family regulator